MIPKIIHYCWFGGNPLPPLALECIASWKKFLPDYEIKEWNEKNFDVNITPYTAEAYLQKKYAFVSDVARLIVIYEQGGIYMDTDVEVIKPLDDLLENKAYMSFENDEYINSFDYLSTNIDSVFKRFYDKRCFFLVKYLRDKEYIKELIIKEFNKRI